MKKSDFTKVINDEMKSQFKSVGMNKAYWCGMHAVLDAIKISASYDEITRDRVELTYHDLCTLAQKLYNLVLDDSFI